jgi:hypothetical protein
MGRKTIDSQVSRTINLFSGAIDRQVFFFFSSSSSSSTRFTDSQQNYFGETNKQIEIHPFLSPSPPLFPHLALNNINVIIIVIGNMFLRLLKK